LLGGGQVQEGDRRSPWGLLKLELRPKPADLADPFRGAGLLRHYHADPPQSASMRLVLARLWS
jgi:hypothetical protein